MYQICGRKELLEKLSLLRTEKQDSTNFSKLMKKADSVSKEHGGDAYTDENKKGTKNDRNTKDIHVVDDYKNVKADKNDVGYEKLSISKEDLKNKFDTSKKGEATPMCSDAVAEDCGAYSERLINSLISCSDTINSTKTAQNLLETLFERYQQLLISKAKAASLTKKIGDSIGIGGKLLDSLNTLHVKLINKYDPMLATYNKRLLLHEIAEKIMDLAILNTEKSLDNIEDRLKSITKIKQTFNSMEEKDNIVADVPYVPEVDKAKGTKTTTQNAMYKQLWGSCGNDNCNNSSNSKGKLINISKNSEIKNKTLQSADKDIVEGAFAIANIGNDLRRQQSLTTKIKEKITNLGNHREKFNKANDILKKFVNKAIKKNGGQQIDFKGISKIAMKYAKGYADEYTKKHAKNINIKSINSSSKSKISKIKQKNIDKYYVTGSEKSNNKKRKKVSQHQSSYDVNNTRNKNIPTSKSSKTFELLKTSDLVKVSDYPELLSKFNADIINTHEASLRDIINIRYKKYFIQKSQKNQANDEL